MITNKMNITEEDKKSRFYREGFEKGFVNDEEISIYHAFILENKFRLIKR